MRIISFNPLTKKVDQQDYAINTPVSTFNGEVKPIEGKNGELFVKQPDGSYKDVSPNAENTKAMQAAELAKVQAESKPTPKFIPATKYQPAGYDIGGKFVPIKDYIKSDVSNGFKPNQITDSTTELDNKNSGSILKQTGLSLNAFNYLTQGTAALTRLSAGQRNQIINESQNFLNKNDLDVSTFQSQYKSYNDVLKKNIERMNGTKIMENEIEGTLSNLGTVADNAELGKLKFKNVAKIWAGEQVNDPLAQKYAFHLQQLKNEMAGYFAASQGKTSPDLVDNQDAEKAIKDGLSKGSISALDEAVKASTEKMGSVMQNSVDATRKATWDLFGVGQNYKPMSSSKKTTTQIFSVNGKNYVQGSDGKYYAQ